MNKINSYENNLDQDKYLLFEGFNFYEIRGSFSTNCFTYSSQCFW